MGIFSEKVNHVCRRLDACVDLKDEIIVFGSQVENQQARADSDLDVMIVTGRDVRTQEETRRIYSVLGGTQPFVDLLVVPRHRFDTWKNTPCTVYHDADQKGVRLERHLSPGT